MIDVSTRVKDALRDGRRLKEYRFVVLKSDGATDFTIDNDYLVKESVKFDERMVTGKELKFGLCEGSSLEFQYFNKPNINGKQIQAFIDVQYKDADGTLKWQTIPMGWFTVDQCPMQFSTGIYKVTAYNKLQSTYLDAPANSEIIEIAQEGEDGTNVISFYKLIEKLLEGYSIESYTKRETGLTVLNTVATVDTNYIPLFNSDGTPLTYESKQVYIAVLYGRWNTYWNTSVVPDLDTYIQTETNYLQKNYIQQTIDTINADITWWGLSNVYVKVYLSDDAETATLLPFEDAIASSYAFKDTTLYGHSKYLYGYIIDADNLGKDVLIYTLSENRLSDTHRAKNYPAEDMMFPYDAFLTNETPGGQHAVTQDFRDYMENMISALGYAIRIWGVEIAQISDMDISVAQAESFSNVTLRDLQSAVYETVCQYGKLDRTTDLFSGIELNQSFLYPADNLYPSDTLYPSGIAESSFKSQYSKLWTDMVGEQSFRNLIITYKGTIVDPDTQQTSEGDKTIEKVVNANGTTDYIMDNNWLFKNLLWADQDVEDYADAMVLKMQSIKWFPFEMWGAGLPYIESGDMIEISDREGNTYTTYILQRQLEGIQNLQDTYINGELDIF